MDTYVTVMATVLTGMGVLFGVWRLLTVAVDGARRDLSAAVDNVRKDLTAEIHAVHQRIDAVNQRIDGVNHRIDAVLLANRTAGTS